MIGFFKKLYTISESLIENFSYSIWNLGITVETYNYPKSKVDIYGENYGFLKLKASFDKNRHNCSICLKCEKSCPNNAIDIKIFPTKNNNYLLLGFEHNLSYCTNCGICKNLCEYDAIEFTGDYEIALSSKDELIIDILKVFREQPL